MKKKLSSKEMLKIREHLKGIFREMADKIDDLSDNKVKNMALNITNICGFSNNEEL